MTYPLYPGFLSSYVHKMLVNGCDFWLFKHKKKSLRWNKKNQRLYDNQTIPKHLYVVYYVVALALTTQRRMNLFFGLSRPQRPASFHSLGGSLRGLSW